MSFFGSPLPIRTFSLSLGPGAVNLTGPVTARIADELVYDMPADALQTQMVVMTNGGKFKLSNFVAPGQFQIACGLHGTMAGYVFMQAGDALTTWMPAGIYPAVYAREPGPSPPDAAFAVNDFPLRMYLDIFVPALSTGRYSWSSFAGTFTAIAP
jgi:hypothetical protein